MERAIKQPEATTLAPNTACVRLTGGSSSHGAWILEDGPGGTAITVGSGADCDWKIKAASVPAHAISVLLLQGAVYVRSGEDSSVLVDGRPLADGWQPVPSGARIDIGLARLEITLGNNGAAMDAWPRTWSVHNIERPSAEIDAGPSILIDEDALRESAPALPPDLDDAEVSGLRPSRQFRPERPSLTGASFARGSRPSLPDAPSLFGRPRTQPGARWLTLLSCGLMAAVYVLWVTLLDR